MDDTFEGGQGESTTVTIVEDFDPSMLDQPLSALADSPQQEQEGLEQPSAPAKGAVNELKRQVKAQSSKPRPKGRSKSSKSKISYEGKSTRKANKNARVQKRQKKETKRR